MARGRQRIPAISRIPARVVTAAGGPDETHPGYQPTARRATRPSAAATRDHYRVLSAVSPAVVSRPGVSRPGAPGRRRGGRPGNEPQLSLAEPVAAHRAAGPPAAVEDDPRQRDHHGRGPGHLPALRVLY